MTWTREMGKIGWREVVNQILNSTEYQQNFGEDKVPGAGRPGCKCCVDTGPTATTPQSTGPPTTTPPSDLAQCPAEQPTSPCPSTQGKYRTINGICNNAHHYLWGSTGISFTRLVPAVGPSSQYIGFKDYVNSRTISLQMVTAGQTPAVDNQRTALLTWWGQFLSHELTFAAENGAPCATVENNFDKCANIDLSPGDVLKATRNTLPLVRTKACSRYGQREQVIDSTDK